MKYYYFTFRIWNGTKINYDNQTINMAIESKDGLFPAYDAIIKGQEKLSESIKKLNESKHIWQPHISQICEINKEQFQLLEKAEFGVR